MADQADSSASRNSAVMQSRSSLSAFERLPPELRNRIYSLVLIEAKPIDLVTWRRRSRFRRPGIRDLVYQALEPSLLAVSKSVRSETLPIFYGANVFEHEGVVGMLPHNLLRIAPLQRSMMRRVVLTVRCDPDAVPDGKGYTTRELETARQTVAWRNCRVDERWLTVRVWYEGWQRWRRTSLGQSLRDIGVGEDGMLVCVEGAPVDQ